MHERSIDSQIIYEFNSKTNQTLDEFISQFDYKNDETVIIKTNNVLTQTQIEINLKKNQSSALSNRIEYKDELETIDLDKIEAKTSGFWSNNSSKIITKFDNFIESEEVNSSSELDDLLIKNENARYVPSVFSKNDSIAEVENKKTANLINEYDFTRFPGEIIAEETNIYLEDKLNLRKLDIFTIDGDSNELASETNNDLVEQFQLDSDYDYNQNIFKPRYEIIENKPLKNDL